MSARLPIALVRVSLLGVRSRLAALGVLPEDVALLDQLLEHMDPTPTADAIRSRRKREKKRAADTPRPDDRPVSRPVSDAGFDPCRPLSALSLSDSAASSSLSEDLDREMQRQSVRATARATAPRPDDRPVSRPDRAARETVDFDDDLPVRDAAECDLDAAAAALSPMGLAGVSPKDRERVRRNMPLLRALADGRGCGIADVLAQARDRFAADCAAKGKTLGNAVLLAQLETWATLPPAPPAPRRLIPLAPAPAAPPDGWADAVEGGLELVRQSIAKAAAE